MSHLSTNTLLTHNRHHATSPAINSTKQSYVEPLSNGKSFGQQSYLMPVLRTQQTPLSRLTGSTIQEKSVFKPIEQQQSSIILDNTPRPTPIHPQTNHYPAPERVNYVKLENYLKKFSLCFSQFSLVQIQSHLMVHEHHNQNMLHLQWQYHQLVK